MQKKQFSKIIPLFILFAIIYVFLGTSGGLNIYDEAVGLFGGERVAGGDLPYLDFWTMYAPGFYYLVALVGDIFGNNIMVFRIMTNLIVLVGIFSILNIGRQLYKNLYGILPAFLALIWLSGYFLYGKAIPVALVLCFVSILFFIGYFKTGCSRSLIFAGLTTAIVMFFRHDFGAYLFIAQSIVFLTASSSSDSDNKAHRKDIIKYWAGTAAIALPLGIYFVSAVGYDNLYMHLIEMPTNIFAEYRSLPFPIPLMSEAASMGGQIKEILFSIVFYLPPIIFLITLNKLFRIGQSENESIRSIPNIIQMLIMICGTLMYSQALVRSDAEHVLPSMMFAILLLPGIFENIKINKLRIVLTLSLSLFVMLLPSLNKAQTLSKVYLSSNSYELTAGKSFGIIVDKEWGKNFDAMIHFIQSEIPEADKIYVGNYSHDRILLNDIMIYYISCMVSGTKYHELHPGVSTTETVQKEMIEEFKNNSVEYIVLCDNSEFLEPNKSSISSEVYLLDEFISENYSEIKSFGSYKILRLD
ncbi:MAG: hypothetical protein PF588_04325 [Candidatus Kapabacteria bacterium]|jgi:hypothetical protein|nr:hypothetical protein [Candidatus Kapabacteria bacterium]